MKFAFPISVITISFFVGLHVAMASTSELDLPTPSSSYRTHSSSTSYFDGNFSLMLPAFVVHGFQPGDDTPQHMPRRMTGNGDVVATPGVGLEYKGKDGFLVLGAVVKDCYDNLAGTFQIGENYKITKNTDWGLTFGIYARETPIACETRSDYPGVTSTHCHEMDSYSWKFMGHWNNESVDIIPMPFLNFSTNLYKSRDLQIDLKFVGNFILNEVGFSVLL